MYPITANRPARWSRRQLLIGTAALGVGGVLLPGCGGADDADDDDGSSIADPARVQAALRALPELAHALQRMTSVPGLALAVVHGGRTVFAQGFGVRQAGGDEPVDADTVFQLASVSKPLGATVVARQVGQGRVGWDTPMRALLSWFVLGDADTAARVSVGDLYAHRSGLPDHAGETLEQLGFAQRDIFERLRQVPCAPLGSAYAYTNLGLSAAAVAVATAAGADWAGLSHTSLYRPLGMTRTTSRHAEFMALTNRATSHVRGAHGWQPTPLRNADVQSAAGGACSSVNDMARWLSLLLARGDWQGRQLVGAAALRAAMTPQAPDGNYGYGFNAGSRTSGGLRLIDHSGAFESGASTSFMLVPRLDLAIIALSNALPIGLPETLCRQFIELAETGRIDTDWWGRYSAAFRAVLAPSGQLVGLPSPAQPSPARPLAHYAGRYASDYFGPLEVEVVAPGTLQLTLGPAAQRLRLRHWSGDDFAFDPPGAVALSGSVSLTRFNQAGDSVWLEYYDDEGLGRFRRHGT